MERRSSPVLVTLIKAFICKEKCRVTACLNGTKEMGDFMKGNGMMGRCMGLGGIRKTVYEHLGYINLEIWSKNQEKI